MSYSHSSIRPLLCVYHPIINLLVYSMKDFDKNRKWVNKNFRIKMQRSRSQSAPKINKLVGFRYLVIVAGDRYYHQIMRRLKSSKADSVTVHLRSKNIKITFYSK